MFVRIALLNCGMTRKVAFVRQATNGNLRRPKSFWTLAQRCGQGPIYFWKSALYTRVGVTRISKIINLGYKVTTNTVLSVLNYPELNQYGCVASLHQSAHKNYRN